MTSTGAGVQGAQVRNQEATIWVGGLEEQVSEELLFELFINAGPVVSVSMPKDKITGQHQAFAFVEFETVEDAEYAIRIMSHVRLYGRHLKINRAAKDRTGDEEFNAKLFVGNLDMEIDEKTLFDHFSQFGAVLSAKIMTEGDSGKSKGFGFITYDSFDSSDRAIEALNGQYLANRPINVNYAFKKDGAKGERHGSKAERELAAKSSMHRIRAAPIPGAAPVPAGPIATPTYLGGRASTAAVAGVNIPPPPPPPFGAPPPPPPPAHLHPSRMGMVPGSHGYGLPPQHQPPPPPPMMGYHPPYGQQPPPPPFFQQPPPFHPQQGYAPPPPQIMPPPPRHCGAFAPPPPPPPPGAMGYQQPPPFNRPPPPPPGTW